MIKNILTLFVNNAGIKKFFNQNCYILHYYCLQFIAIIIEILMMLRMHIDKNLNISADDVKKKQIIIQIRMFYKK